MLQKRSLASAAASSSASSSLFSFVPRSVVLARLKMTSANGVLTANGGASAGKGDKKALLLQSICKYLKANGLTKTVKKLKSEAKLDEDATTGLDLKEIFSKYLEASFSDLKTPGESDKGVKSNGDTKASKEDDSEIENVTKKKKKAKKDAATGCQDASISKKFDDKPAAEVISEPDVKIKEKKKTKKAVEAASPEENTKEIALKCDTESATEKDKKKKKQKPVEDAPTKDSKSTKGSKKRKLDSAEDDDTQVAGPSADDVVTPRKTDEGKGEETAAKMAEDKNGVIHQTGDATNGNGVDTAQKSAKRQKNGSAEPTTVKAFQRVKVDEVVIKDERLKDNSYWAKDGAEFGYGAKAQEVLGQVRGKDFRHEKTKKKRGSYRGGNIDLQSHSVKFNDSDDE